MYHMVGLLFFLYQDDFSAPLKWRPGHVPPCPPPSYATVTQSTMGWFRVNLHQSNNLVFTLGCLIISCALFGDQQLGLLMYVKFESSSCHKKFLILINVTHLLSVIKCMKVQGLDSVAKVAVYTPNWATLKSPAAGQITIGRVA